MKFTKRPFRTKFLPNAVFLALDAHRYNVETLKAYLNRFKITVEIIENGIIAVAGEFCESGRIYLTIFSDYSKVVLSDDDWYMFKFRLIQTITHELIHWRQFEKRGHGESRVLKYVSKHDQAAYYSSVDEIVAYSHCILLEIHRDFPEMLVVNVIDEYYSETSEHIFDEIFDNNVENLALIRYKKEILRWEKTYKS